MYQQLTAVVATLLMSLPAWAQDRPPSPGPGAHGPGWHHGMRGGWEGPDMMGCAGMMMGWDGNPANLTSDQRNKIYAIQRELRNKQFALMDKMHDTMAATRYYTGGKFDEQSARGAYEGIEKLHRQMFENMLDARKRMDGVLTPQQRQQLSQPNQ